MQGSAHLTTPRPEHLQLSWLISPFPMGLRPLLTKNHTFGTSVIHTWQTLMGQPALNKWLANYLCHEWARDWPIRLLSWHLSWRSNQHTMRTCEHWSLLPHVQRYSWSSQHSRWGSLLSIITLDLVMLVCELGSQRWHTGFMWGRKPALFLNLMEICFGSQDLKLPFLCPISQVDVMSVHSPTELPWMRLVQAAANSKEQNLEAYLENSQLYYRSTRKINKNEELLVWYDEELSSLLGFNEIKAQRPRNGKYQIADCRGHWGPKCVCSFFSMWWSCNTGNKTCLYL